MRRDVHRQLAEARLRRAEARIAMALRRALASQQERAIARLRGLQAAGVPVDPFGEDAWDAALDEEVEPTVEAVLSGIGATAVASLLATFARSGRTAPDLPPPDVRPATEQLMTQLRGIAADANTRMTGTLSTMQAEGASIRDMEGALRDSFAMTARRAETIARTETARTVNRANRDAMRPAADAGVVGQRQWLATADEHTRESHAEADGQTIPFDGSYQVGDDLLEFPGDPSGSPEETVNCRCTELFLEPTSDTDQPDEESDAEE